MVLLTLGESHQWYRESDGYAINASRGESVRPPAGDKYLSSSVRMVLATPPSQARAPMFRL